MDIASKALSPAINDPTTAVQALDQIHHLLLLLGRRHLDDGRVRDRAGQLRLVYGTPDWPDYVMLAVARSGSSGPAACRWTAGCGPCSNTSWTPSPRTAGRRCARNWPCSGSAVERKFQDEEDRRRAGVADYQGVGGSES